jgi:hypothetical protein
MRRLYDLIFTFILHYQVTSQALPVNRQMFFLDERVIEVTLTTYIKKLRTEKKVPSWQPANITMQFSDTSVISEQISVQPRGIYRKNYCDIAALMLNFKTPTSPKLSALNKLKLVGGCSSSKNDEELLLKEYLVYKIYNFLSVMSYRVRLLHINYKDSKEKVRSYSQYAFLIEDTRSLADRNNCKEIKKRVFALDGADRQQFNFVCLFQYMIGNTDWSVRQYHNIKLMVPKTDTLAKPYVIAYDFDFAGLVNASYAIPNEGLGITTVTERLYRGFARTMDELQANLDIFKAKKDAIMFYLNNCSLISTRVKKNMARYLEEFYDTIDDKKSVKAYFINMARVE